jgi:adenylate cyclase
MKAEIERKFRLLRYARAGLDEGVCIRQGYLSFDPEIRVRIYGARASLTIKRDLSRSDTSIVREEFEYSIPLADAESLLSLASAHLTKTRYRIDRFEVDVFEGPLVGLAILEAELSHAEERMVLPDGFVAVEVTGDVRFLNQRLARTTSLDELA